MSIKPAARAFADSGAMRVAVGEGLLGRDALLWTEVAGDAGLAARVPGGGRRDAAGLGATVSCATEPAEQAVPVATSTSAASQRGETATRPSCPAERGQAAAVVTKDPGPSGRSATYRGAKCVLRSERPQ
jgi:hypothetical protein